MKAYETEGSKMSDSLSQLTSKVFAQHQHSRFKTASDGVAMELVLTTVVERHSAPNIESFSLVFSGPRTPQLPQRIHRMEHEQLGALEIFLTPIGADADKVTYEAVFNRLRKDTK